MKKSNLLLIVLMILGSTILSFGKELPTDLNKLTKMAKKGNVEAQLKLGDMYYNGTDVERNPDEAKYYYELAVKKNAPLGYVGLGNCYLNGLGAPKDRAEAFKLFKTAAGMGCIEGKAELGYCYYKGYGVDKNLTEAFKLGSEAAAQGNPEGKYLIGLCYLYGYGGAEENKDKGYRYLQEAFIDGIGEAGYQLGNCYLRGWGTEKNPETAFKLFLSASGYGDPACVAQIARCMLRGEGTEKNPEKGFELLLYAKEIGANVDSEIADCYFKGMGVEKNIDKAVELYKECGSAYGIGQIAEAYLKGDGVEKNTQEAIKYYDMAADMGDSYETNKIGNIYYNGIGVPINYDKAVKYYKMAIDKDNYKWAWENLARCYVFGQGVPQSYEEAEKIYTQLANQGEDVKDELYMCKIKGNYYKGLVKFYNQPMDGFSTMILEDNMATFYAMNQDMEFPYTLKKSGNKEILDLKMHENVPYHTLTSDDNGLSWAGKIGSAQSKLSLDFWLLKWPYYTYLCYMDPEHLKSVLCSPEGYNVFIAFQTKQGIVAALSEAYFKEDGRFYIKYDNPLLKSNLKDIKGTFTIDGCDLILNTDQGTVIKGYIYDNGDFISIFMGKMSGMDSAIYFIR